VFNNGGRKANKNGVDRSTAAHAAKDSHQRGSWLVCRREILLNLQFHPAKITHDEKRTLYIQWLNFFRLTDAKYCVERHPGQARSPASAG
jgi:hypothetical protein